MVEQSVLSPLVVRMCSGGSPADQLQRQLVREIGMGNPGVGWLGPNPILLGEQSAHGIDVAVVGGPLNQALFSGGRANHLHEQHPETALRFKPLMQLTRVVDPMVGMNRTQAGLLVDRGKLFFRLVTQHIRLKDFGLQASGVTKRSCSCRRGSGVVQAYDVKSTLGQLSHFPAAAAARNRYPAGPQCAARQPREKLRAWAAAVPTGFFFLKTLLPKFSCRASHVRYLCNSKHRATSETSAAALCQQHRAKLGRK